MRKPRELQVGARYHVMARANRREMILKSTSMKVLFLSVIRRAKKKFSFRLENFCVMGNHFHFIIRPEKGESLSRIMQWILSVFAMAFNRNEGYTGHVWGGRFLSRILGTLRDYLSTFVYIDQNPVCAGLAFEAKSWVFGGCYHARKGWHFILDPPLWWIVLFFPAWGQRRLPRDLNQGLSPKVLGWGPFPTQPDCGGIH